MISLAELEKENKEITELCAVLGTLIQDHSLHSNTVVCDLLDRFMSLVNSHLTHEDRTIYGDLLAKHTAEADKLASHFLGNTQELKRICKSYKKDWCRTPRSEEDQDQYTKESMDIFRLVCDRIEFETSKIFPILKKAA